ncbi:carboxymuconolactone decarboxylase family protein [Chloroflexota bacterium]
MSDSERQERGQSIIQQLQGGTDKDEIFSLIEEVFPDFLKVVTEEQIFGDVWSRPGLALRERAMIVMAVLIAFRFTDELKAHMRYALNIGLSQEEILEVIMQVAPYTCWGCGVGATRLAGEVFSAKE